MLLLRAIMTSLTIQGALLDLQKREDIRLLYIVKGTDLWTKPLLTATMFADRRRQFAERLGWPVTVDPNGYERDDYDKENPWYIIVSDKAGKHAGSLRLLPTTGRTMLADHFAETLAGREIKDPLVWECTRFCLSPERNPKVALTLLATAARLMQLAGLRSLVAVFDARMLRLYRMSGVEPEVIGSPSHDTGAAQAGLWYFDKVRYQGLLKASEIDPLELEMVTANADLPLKSTVLAIQ